MSRSRYLTIVAVAIALALAGCGQGAQPQFRRPSPSPSPAPARTSQAPTSLPHVTASPRPFPVLAAGGNVQRYLTSAFTVLAGHTLGSNPHPAPPLLAVTGVRTCTDPDSGQPVQVGDQADAAAPALFACTVNSRLTMVYSPQAVARDARSSRQQWLTQIIIAYQYFLRALHGTTGPNAGTASACLNGLIAGGLLVAGYLSSQEAEDNAPVLGVADTSTYYLGLQGHCTS
jgi:hypothetical protein